MESMNTIIVRTDAEFIHRYMGAPEGVEFLKEWHRHRIKITVEMEVFHDDRELEFILVRRLIDSNIINGTIGLYYVEKSCELVAREIAELLIATYGDRRMRIEISEDGENSGVYYRNCSL